MEWKLLPEHKEGLLLGHSVAFVVYEWLKAVACSWTTLTNTKLRALVGTVKAQGGVSEEDNAV